ncbi:GntR family transcriptional regulator [Herbiconiux sp. VKM Ac-1786]|uniref:GntR family transcriptional regulator n=1 Tax=Herbiconiux sp. VKM Ac-1786 TaxID=2783824 RepID=UPI00188BBE20|nr:GntR family transcriptional regulator [Herbiconiux sp. VKM Ac-1786]MBF4571795.1 GntR family transcriptional regulator [Herbiconiux sp. VKM Ac-1786]
MITTLLPVRQQSLGSQVSSVLRDLIIRRELAPGTHLVEDALAAEYDVSRGPIRDALRQLESEGLVESRRRGIFVVGIELRDIEDLYSLREAIEELALRLAMERATPDQWVEGRRLVDAMRAAADRQDEQEFARADVDFHALLYRLSGHRRLVDVWGQYEPILTSLLQVTVAEDVDLHPSAEDHQRLLDIVATGDQDAAVRAIREHLEGAKHRMIHAYSASVGELQAETAS